VPRKLRAVEQLQFSVASLTPIVARMDRLAAAGDGWVNFVPSISDRRERPTTLGFMALFSGGGSGATMITWIPGRSDKRGAVGPSLGITHATGHRAVAALASADVPVPATWTIEQDHPRRGLILRLPADAGNEEVVTWAVRAVGALNTPRQLTSWRAEVHLPAT
jgi:hypothetical protein